MKTITKRLALLLLTVFPLSLMAQKATVVVESMKVPRNQ